MKKTVSKATAEVELPLVNEYITVKVSKTLLDQINEKRSQRVEAGYSPHIVILWDGYMTGLRELIRHFEFLGNTFGESCPARIFDLTIEWTDIPDTVEVY